jgi:putative ABC transport system substrate-binding protein
MKRREFIAGLGSVAAWPTAARAQQPKMPVIGLLNGVSNEAYADRIAYVRQGLREQGVVEDQNVTFEYRSAEGQYDRLPALAVDLVRRQVAVIVAIGSTNSPQAASTATSSIPIVFVVGGDPVANSLVTNFRRPEANLTGTTFFPSGLTPKLFEIAHDLLPKAKSMGYLMDSTTPIADDRVPSLTAAVRTLGCELSVFGVGTEQEIKVAFQSMEQQQIAALVLSNDASMFAYSKLIIALAAHHGIPAISPLTGYARRGGLIGYGPDLLDSYRWAGIYAGRILKGEQPANLPVQQPTRFRVGINLRTAKALDLTVPDILLARADEVIE